MRGYSSRRAGLKKKETENFLPREVVGGVAAFCRLLSSSRLIDRFPIIIRTIVRLKLAPRVETKCKLPFTGTKLNRPTHSYFLARMQKKNLENIISEATGFSSKPRNASYRVGRIKKKKRKRKKRGAPRRSPSIFYSPFLPSGIFLSL